MILFGDTEQELKDALDRIEGRSPAAPPPLDESETYGEVYGVLGSDLLDKVLSQSQPEIAARLKEAARKVSLHVSAMGDVGIVADVEGADEQQAGDLARSLGAALSLGRIKAQAQDEKDLAELLDLAKVSPGGTSFQVELALPMAFLERHLAFCRAGPDAGTLH